MRCNTQQRLSRPRPCSLSWFPGPNVGAQSLKGVGVSLPLSSCEDVGGRHQLHVYETGLLDSIQVLSLQESSADSSSPQIHVRLSSIRDRFVYHYIGEIQTATRFQRPEDLIKHHVLVRAQVDDSVGNGYVHRGVRHW